MGGDREGRWHRGPRTAGELGGHSADHIASFLPTEKKGASNPRLVRAPKCLTHHTAVVPHLGQAGDRQRGFYAPSPSPTV